MPDPDFVIKQFDTASSLSQALEDEDGNLADITGADVEWAMTPIAAGATVVLGGSAAITGATIGGVRYDWQPGDTDIPGLYLGEWQVTYDSGARQTFPNGDYVFVRITPYAGSVT